MTWAGYVEASCGCVTSHPSGVVIPCDAHRRPATDERDQVMIFRTRPRVVATACLGCGLSIVACQSWAEHEQRRCCPDCDH